MATATATTHITMVIVTAIGTIGVGTRPIGVVTHSTTTTITTIIGMRPTTDTITTQITAQEVLVVPTVAVIGNTMSYIAQVMAQPLEVALRAPRIASSWAVA